MLFDEKRIIFLGKENNRAFLLAPQFFRPKWQPTWMKRNALRCDVYYDLCFDVYFVVDPVSQAVRAVHKKIDKKLPKRKVTFLGESDSRGCSAPIMKWCFCLIDWSPEALRRLPPEFKLWLVDEQGNPLPFHEKLFCEAQRLLELPMMSAQSAAA